MEKKLQKAYLIDYNLLIAQDLWQGHYQIISIIMGTMVKNAKLVEWNINIVLVSLNIQTWKMI